MIAKDILYTYFYKINYSHLKKLNIFNKIVITGTWGGYFKTKNMKLYTEEYKSLEEHNSKDSNWNRHIYDRSPRPNGITCPNCGKELMDSNPIFTLTSCPPKKSINCSSCDYVGYRIA